MYCEHPDLESINNNCTIWKYLKFSKFVSILTNSALWFNRIDNFEDIFECSYPSANEKLRNKLYQDTGVPPKEMYDKIMNLGKERMYVSCFHENEFESAAMWELYAKDEGIAIYTQINNLKNAFKNEKRNIYISKVNYIDFKEDVVPESNIFYLGLHKRKSFIHENEIRCIYLDNPNYPQEKGKKGILINIDLNTLIKKVFISPHASSYLKNEVEALLIKYNCNAEVINSPLYKIR